MFVSMSQSFLWLHKTLEADFTDLEKIDADWMLLINQSMVNVFCNKHLPTTVGSVALSSALRSIVSVVTRGISDDANGVILKNHDQVWLKLIRKGNTYSMHWSIDGKDYKMARISNMPVADSVKIGIEVQCPVGESAVHEINFFDIEQRTVQDLRKGE